VKAVNGSLSDVVVSVVVRVASCEVDRGGRREYA
jgi:hypothetical protein